jgi:hypothetical protein
MTNTRTSAYWQVTCQCGWRTHGTWEVVVAAVKEHARQTHGLEVSEAEVRAQAVPAGSQVSAAS